MDRNPAKWMEKYNYVFTDVRGSGCNEFSVEDMPDNAIRTEYAAQDIAAIVDYLDDPNKSGIQLGKYIIHGSSYGTVLATVSGHKIQNSLTPKPTAIILEGTLGRQRQFTYEYQSSTISGYVDQISRRLPAEIFSILGGSEPPFGLTKSEWVFWMEALMTKGSQITEAGEAKFYRHGLESFMLSKPTAEMIQEIKDAYKSNAENRIKETRAYPNLACRELFVCKDVALDRSFDSADYQLHTPLYYFHGTFDPRTLLEEGRYHFDNQYYSEKYFITFKEGGHGPLQLELASGMHNIFERIVEGRGSIELLFDKWINAGVPLVVETAGPGFVASQY